MKLLDFNYIAAENHRCFGPDGIEINLKEYGNIVHVRGDNLDVVDEEERIASNGSGKSSLLGIIPYTLFGKAIKNKLSHKELINNQSKSKMRTEVRWDNYRVVRTRKKDTLRFWEDDKEITLGGMPDTQKLIEDRLGLNYETFCSISVFTDDNSGSFLECDTATKRQIVENLLSLEKYRLFGETSKQLRNDFKQSIVLLQKEYEFALKSCDAAETRLQQIEQDEKNWKAGKQKELSALIAEYKGLQAKLKTSDTGAALLAYKEAQAEIKKLNNSIPELEKEQSKLEAMVVETEKQQIPPIRKERDQLAIDAHKHASTIGALEVSISRSDTKIDDLRSQKDGTKCPTCYGEIKHENFKNVIQHEEEQLKNARSEIAATSAKLAEIKAKIKDLDGKIDGINQGIGATNLKICAISKEMVATRNKITELAKIKQPAAKVDEAVIQSEIENLRKQILAKQDEINGASPYEMTIKSAQDEITTKKTEADDKRAQLQSADGSLPYYDFWVKAFGDAGIRKFVIDGIIPSLNSRVAYWLQFLIDGKINLEFNNELEETISRYPADGDPFVYHAMSGGERRRLNLAVSQAFAMVMMLSCGRCPSFVFLDEVSSNIDRIGVSGIYNMICELSKERQVFITTHDSDLLEMLGGCDTINLVKKSGFTHLKK